MLAQNEREIAINILQEVLEENAYNNIAIRRTFEKNKSLTLFQKSFITEVVNGTLRNVMYIDYIIDTFSKIKTNKMKSFILYTLRISVFQIYFMDKVPNSAICNEAVKLTKKRGFLNLAPFVNGLLRNIIRNINNTYIPEKDIDPSLYLSIKYSYPKWIIDYWLEDMNIDEVEEICNDKDFFYKTTLCINTLKTNKDDLKKVLEKEEMKISKSNLSKNTLFVTKTDNIAQKNSYINGLYHVMDESSMLAVDVADMKENDVVFDVCSAPGGKSFYSSYKMKNKGHIMSFDIHEHKIKLIEDGYKRLGIDIIECIQKDSTLYDENLFQKADVLLIDAPCSGLGLLRKKPDIKYKKTMNEILELVELQKNIIKASINYLKVGGTLVYSTCTISKKENIEIVEFILKNYNFEIQEISQYLPENPKNGILLNGCIQILPNESLSDGFFIAKLKNKGEIYE